MAESYQPQFIQEYMQYTEDSEPPEQFRLWSAIAIISAACESRFILTYGMKKFLLNKYIILVGPSGCRKSEAIGQALRLYAQVEGLDMSPDAITERSLKDCIQFDTDQRGNQVERLKSCQMPGHDEPYEYHSILIQAPEFKAFFDVARGSIIPFLTRIYDSDFSDRWHYQTGHFGAVSLKNPSVTILGGSTIEWLTEALPASAIGGGFTARCHFIYASSFKKKSFPQADPSLIPLEKKLVGYLRAIANRAGYIGWLPKASKWYASWYESFETPLDCDPMLVPWYARYQVHLMKLAAISVVADFRKSLLIEVKDLLWAKELLDTAVQKMHLVFGGIGTNKLASVQSRLEALLKESSEPLTKPELFKIFYRDASPIELAKLLEELAKAGIIGTKIYKGQTAYYLKQGR